MHDAESDKERDIGNARILASFGPRASESGSEDSPDTDDDPSLEYVRLKMKLVNLTTSRQAGDKTDASQVPELRSRLAQVMSNYFFDEKEAEARYRAEREQADALALQARLRGTLSSLTSDISPMAKPVKRRPPNLQPSVTSPVVVSDIFDGDDDDLPGGMFEILEDMPESETTEQGTTVRIRDMALPKHWSGRTPKKLLTESVAKADRYAAITYNIISGHSRAKRAAVSIRWEGRKMGEWVMEDVACHDASQAEQYIATVALHALTFPSTEGFAAGTSTAAGSQTFFRLLPAVFRDLWDELEFSRKANDDSVNRSVWAKLRSIIEPKLEVNEKVDNFLTPPEP